MIIFSGILEHPHVCVCVCIYIVLCYLFAFRNAYALIQHSGTINKLDVLKRLINENDFLLLLPWCCDDNNNVARCWCLYTTVCMYSSKWNPFWIISSRVCVFLCKSSKNQQVWKIIFNVLDYGEKSQWRFFRITFNYTTAPSIIMTLWAHINMKWRTIPQSTKDKLNFHLYANMYIGERVFECCERACHQNTFFFFFA